MIIKADHLLAPFIKIYQEGREIKYVIELDVSSRIYKRINMEDIRSNSIPSLVFGVYDHLEITDEGAEIAQKMGIDLAELL